MERELESDLERWLARGIISSEQAAEIRRVESEREPEETAAPARASRRAVVAEVVGSLGAIAAAAAAVAGTAVMWGDLTTGARIAIPALGAVGLFGAGAVVPRGGDRPSERLGALLWLLALASLGAVVAIVCIDVLELAAQNVLLVTGAVVLVAAVAMLRRRPEALVELGVVGAAVLVALGLVMQYDEVTTGQAGVVLACLGGIVMLVGWAGVLPDETTAYLSGAALVLVGTEMLADIEDHWPVIVGLALSALLLGTYLAVRSKALLVSGLVLAVVFIVQGIVLLSQRSGGTGPRRTWVVLVVFAIGAVVLAAAIIAIRSPGRPRPDLHSGGAS